MREVGGQTGDSVGRARQGATSVRAMSAGITSSLQASPLRTSWKQMRSN